MQSATSRMDKKHQKKGANTRLHKSQLPQVIVSPKTTELALSRQYVVGSPQQGEDPRSIFIPKAASLKLSDG